MEQKPIRLLIVDDSLETCDILENYFALTPHVTVCGVAHDGSEALFHIEQCQPHVMLLDLIMPKTDGMAVLEKLHHSTVTSRPKVIVTSAVGQDNFTSAALGLGADYYMIKPYDLADLYARVCTAAASTGAERPVAARKEEAPLLISRMLMDMGVPTHMLGYHYCCAAVQLLLRSEGPQSIVKDVYHEIAKRYSTTPECVEGAVRKVLRRAWATDREPICVLTGSTEEESPSNGRFLTALSQRIRTSQEN